MAHPLDEVQYTPWGRRVDDDINLLKRQYETLDRSVSSLHIELKSNTIKTDSVKADTQALVYLFRGGQAIWRILIGVGVILSGIAAVGAWLGWLHPK